MKRFIPVLWLAVTLAAACTSDPQTGAGVAGLHTAGDAGGRWRERSAAVMERRTSEEGDR